MVESPDQGPPDYLTILVVKLSDIGDVLTATPALRALRESFPAARLDALVPPNSAPVLAQSPLVDDVIVFDKFQYDRPIDAFKPSSLAALVRFARDLRRQHYDCLVILHHLTTRWGTLKYAALALTSRAKVRVGLDNGRGWFLTHRVCDRGFGARHEVEYWLDVVGTIGAETEDTSLEITIGADDENFASEQIPITNDQCPLVAIHPGSGGYSLARRWSAEGFARLADALAERHGARIVLVGTPADGVSQVASLMNSEAMDLEGKTNLSQLAAILKRCDLFIGADSGVMHLAAAVDTPLVAIFGPSNHRAWGPWPRDGRHVILRADLPCSPCSYVGYRVGQREGCQAMTCMKAIAPEMVLAAAERLLQGNTDFKLQTSNPSASLRAGVKRQTSTILGVRIDNVSYNEVLSIIEGFVVSGEPHQVVTVNPEFIVAAQSDDDFRRILNASSLALPDGVGLLWAARFLGRPLQERVTGTDTVQRIAALAAQKGYSLFLLGAVPGVAVDTAARLCQTCPGLRIVGTHAGSPALEEEDEIVRLIQRAKPDILLVAYGAPQQDKWIARNLVRLGVPVAMGVGGAFDFISGRAKRAPRWLQRFGLEWLHRLLHEPWRWRRMLALPKFVWLVVWERLAKR
jgi:lipopolysaccharide heptosyltransferase II